MPDHIVQLSNGRIFAYDDGVKNVKEFESKDVSVMKDMTENELFEFMAKIQSVGKIR